VSCGLSVHAGQYQLQERLLPLKARLSRSNTTADREFLKNKHHVYTNLISKNKCLAYISTLVYNKTAVKQLK
jgi:hypothetical protein